MQPLNPDCSGCDLKDTIEKLAVLTAKIEALDNLNNVAAELADVKKGFSILYKVIIGVGTFATTGYGFYQFLKNHWKP